MVGLNERRNYKRRHTNARAIIEGQGAPNYASGGNIYIILDDDEANKDE
jgi:hypothetical protein